MKIEHKRIVNFTDLYAWVEGHKLVLEVYQITCMFPKEELFGLTNQIRRAVVSITSNIAEGFSRNSIKEKLQFWALSIGSLTEVQNQLLVAKDVGYLDANRYEHAASQAVTVNKLMHGLVKKTKELLNQHS